MLTNAIIAVRTLAVALALSGAAVTAASDGAMFDQASQLYRQSRWAEAAEAFDRFLLGPVGPVESATASYFAAECFTQIGETQSALERYQKLLDSDPPKPYRRLAQFRLGEAAWKLGSANEAKASLRLFTAARTENEYEPYAWCYLGKIAAAEQNWSEAVEAYARAIEQFPSGQWKASAQLGLANALIAQSRPQPALEILEPLTKSTDETIASVALLAISRAQFTAGDYELAVESAHELTARFSNSSESSEVSQARIVAGWALWKLDRFEEIEAWLAPIATVASFANEVHILQGMTAYARQDWATARDLLAEAAELASQRLNLAFYAGESARRAADGATAEKWLQRTIDGAPDGPWADDALWSLAQLAAAAGEAERAEECLSELQAKFPQSPYSASDFGLQATRQASLLVEAVSLERDGRYGAALAAYQELNAQPPSEQDGEALWRNALLLERLEHREEAAALLERLITEFPIHRRTAAARLSLAYRTVGLHDAEVAIKKFRQVQIQHPETPQAAEAACWLAGRLIEQGNYSEARKQLDTVFANNNIAEGDILPQAQHLLLTIEIGERNWSSARLAALRLEQLAGEASLGVVAEFWLAEAEFRLGNDEAALAAFEAFNLRVAGLDENVAAMAPLRIAQLEARRQSWSQVLETLADHEAKFPLFGLQYEVKYLRGRALAGRGEMREARAAYRQVLAAPSARGSETAAMAQWMIGETYFHQENYEAARAAYAEVIERHRQPAWQARAALQAGKCCELLDEWQAAAEFYRQAPQAETDADSRKQLQARLQWTQTRLARSSAVNK